VPSSGQGPYRWSQAQGDRIPDAVRSRARVRPSGGAPTGLGDGGIGSAGLAIGHPEGHRG